MATLKRCDSCGEVWDPEDYKMWDGTDKNRAHVSLHIPRDPDRTEYRERDEVTWDGEVCAGCARDVLRLLKNGQE